MKKAVILCCLAAVSVLAKEKTSDQPASQPSELVTSTTRASEHRSPVSYASDDVRILGDLKYGQNSGWIDYSPTPQYSAFVFSAYGGQKVEVSVKGSDRRAFVALADSSLSQIDSGATHLSVQLPYRGPDIEVWYIVFRSFDNQPARFTVQVNKTPQRVRSNVSPAPRQDAPRVKER